nr:hypothetical protein [Tanacetum cinerariifolium]
MATIPAKKDAPVRVKIIPKVITKALNFSVHRRASGGQPDKAEYYVYDEADRISLLELYVDIATEDTAKVVFNDWDKFVSVYGTVDLGQVTSAQNWSATANLSANLASVSTGKNTNSLTNTLGSIFSNNTNQKTTNTVSGTTNSS